MAAGLPDDEDVESKHADAERASGDYARHSSQRRKAKASGTPGQWPPAQDLPYLASIPPLSPPTSTGEPRATERQSVLNLVNCLLGAGILGYPYCFRSCGIGLATAIMAVSILAGRLSYQLLLHCAHLTQRRSYEELAQAALGRAGRWTVEICTAALNLGAVVAYLNVLADVLSAVAGTLIPPGAEPSRQSYIAGVTLFGALPVALVVRDHSVVGTFAAASVGFVILFAAVILVLALSPAATAAATAVAAATAATGTAATAASAVKMWEMEGLLVAFPVMAYGFTAHPYYLPIYSMLQAPSLPRMARVTDAAIALCALLYWAVGAGGYLVFRQRTSGDVLRNFGGPHVHGLRGAYERALKLCYGFAILGAIPLVIQPFYSLLLPVLGGGGSGGRRSHKDRAAARATVRKDSNYGLVNDDDEEGATAWQRQQQEARLLLGSQGSGLLSFGGTPPLSSARPSFRSQSSGRLGMWQPPSLAHHALVCVLILGMGLASALWMPNVEFIFGLTGATASVVIAYILPPVLYVRLVGAAHEPGRGGDAAGGLLLPREPRRQWVCRRRLALLLLIFGVVSCVLCTDAIINAVKEEQAVVQLAQELVAHEAVAAETSRAERKAKEAAAAVLAVEAAATELALGLRQRNVTFALGQLRAAEAQLRTLQSQGSWRAGGVAPHRLWDLTGKYQEHRTHTAELRLLYNVEDGVQGVQADVASNIRTIVGVLGQLDIAIASIKEDAARHTIGAQTFEAVAQVVAQAATVSASPTAAATADSAAADSSKQSPGAEHQLPASDQLQPQAQGQGADALQLPPRQDVQQQQHQHQQQHNVENEQQSAQPPGAIRRGGGDGKAVNATVLPLLSTSTAQQQHVQDAKESGTRHSRAADLAEELGRVADARTVAKPAIDTAGKSLELVRAQAEAAKASLEHARSALQKAATAVAVARRDVAGDAALHEAALSGMARAVNATEGAELAVRLTSEALQTAASEETLEMLTLLLRVSKEMEKSNIGGNSAVKGHAEGPGTLLGQGSEHGLAGADIAQQAAASNGSVAAQAGGDHAAALDLADQATAAAGAPVGSPSAKAAADEDGGAAVHATAPVAQSPAAGAVAPDNTLQIEKQGSAQQQQEQQQQQQHFAGSPAPAAAGSQSGVDLATGATAPKATSATAAPQPNATAVNGPLTEEERQKVQAIITQLTRALIEGTSSRGAATSTDGAALQPQPLPQNISALVQLLNSVVRWTRGSKAAVIADTQAALGSSNERVQKRVTDIIQDLGSTAQEAQEAQPLVSAGQHVTDAHGDPRQLPGFTEDSATGATRESLAAALPQSTAPLAKLAAPAEPQAAAEHSEAKQPGSTGAEASLPATRDAASTSPIMQHALTDAIHMSVAAGHRKTAAVDTQLQREAPSPAARAEAGADDAEEAPREQSQRDDILMKAAAAQLSGLYRRIHIDKHSEIERATREHALRTH